MSWMEYRTLWVGVSAAGILRLYPEGVETKNGGQWGSRHSRGAREVATRPVEAGDEANFHRVGVNDEDKWGLSRSWPWPRHVRGSGLLLERFGEIAGARLHVIEQPHVLDGYDRLLGEGLQQRNLPLGEQSGSSRATAIPPMGSPSRTRSARLLWLNFSTIEDLL